MSKKKIAMTVSYDGTEYHGFQTQPGGQTVQDAIEAGIRALTGKRVKIHGSGRTDAGVHARRQVFHFIDESPIPVHAWRTALNARMPGDIVITGATEVPDDFHARRSVKRKTYCYTIHNARWPDVFQRKYRLHIIRPLNTAAMRSALPVLLGEHDFRSFCSPNTRVTGFVRTIHDAELTEESIEGETDPGRLLRIRFTGNGFLYHMVRILSGTLIEIGQGKRSPENLQEVLAARDRKKAGPTAPAHGLMLWDVEYEQFLS